MCRTRSRPPTQCKPFDPTGDVPDRLQKPAEQLVREAVREVHGPFWSEEVHGPGRGDKGCLSLNTGFTLAQLPGLRPRERKWVQHSGGTTGSSAS